MSIITYSPFPIKLNYDLDCLQLLNEARTIEEKRAREQGQLPTPSSGRRPGTTPGSQKGTPGQASPAGALPHVTPADFKLPAEYANDVFPSLFSANVQPLRPTKGPLGGQGPYLRGAHMREVAADSTNSLGKGPQKGLEATWAEVGWPLATATHYPKVYTRATCGAYLALRQEILDLLELRRQATSKQSGGKKRPGDTASGMRSDKRPRVQKKYD